MKEPGVRTRRSSPRRLRGIAADALTDKVAVIIQDRPVIAMTACLSDAFRAAANAEPGLQIGPRSRPALYYPLPGDPSDLSGWQDFERLMRHLKGA
ncbi:DUF6177 family protein [Streptomyces sp. NPDC057600]|uniref:DUF6177 family protein n=1 Tax=Streptomyces sp. NPDC057600 TaxID=3346180 RepID=UPI0036BA6837